MEDEYNQAQLSTSYNHSEVPYRSDDTSRHHGQENDLIIVRSASKQVLLASGNAAYFELFQENMQLKAELGAKKELVAHLMEKDKFLAFNQPPPPSTTNRSSPSTLVVPIPPPSCDRNDFEDVKFWTRAEWNTYIDRQNEKGNTPSKLGFLYRQDGQMIEDARLTAINKRAQELWVELYHERQNPSTWSNKTRTAADFFSNSMRLEFEEFRYCDNDWKIEAYATLRYPDFARYI